MNRRGYFVTVEGGEGAGKTSAIGEIVKTVTGMGAVALSTREPGGIPIAEKIREVILDRSHTAMDGRTEALLYAAARRQHLSERVVPALQAGQVVVCDRFIDSSLAYQGHARGLGMEEVLSVNAFAVGDWMPDLTLYMDVSPEVGLMRIQADTSRELNRLDLEKIEFHRKVREGYLLLLERYPERIVRIDAEAELSRVLGEIRRILNQRLAGRV
ncbi:MULTISPECIES: dTMP kinase [Paenibacillus]|uniref:dTMP kinase n=1 Tax=Paenibacillus TaxID=44249 RepID=UPI0022B86296|nr:dTMP kinase [Paenibacillus caseinilyticus]MCZ8523728.1 dTMP kinase [Paenibacillus caseinilyticus]